MSTDQASEDIFNETESGGSQEAGGATGTESVTATAETNTADAFAEYVGEGKKYANVDEFVKGFKNAQQFIEQLKEENQGLRGELKTNEKLDELLDRVAASGRERGHDRDDGTSRETPSNDTGTDEAGRQQEISRLVEEEITKRERNATAKQNELEASDKLVELAGGRSEAQALVKQAASDLGVTVSYLREQSQISPTAFLRIVQASHERASTDEAPTERRSSGYTGSHNAEAIASRTARPEGRYQPVSFFKKLKQDMTPSEYYSPEVQNRLMESRAELGDAFWDTH